MAFFKITMKTKYKCLLSPHGKLNSDTHIKQITGLHSLGYCNTAQVDRTVAGESETTRVIVQTIRFPRHRFPNMSAAKILHTGSAIDF